LKVNDENSRIRIQDPYPDPNPDLDPLVRDMDPRIRIRIHTKMSWIRNTDENTVQLKVIKCEDTGQLKIIRNQDTVQLKLI
jgi:hypothetical protein